MQVIEERENGWLVGTRGKQVVLAWTLDAKHSQDPKHQAKTTISMCNHGKRELPDNTISLKLIESFDVPAIVRKGMLGGPKAKDEQLVKYKRIRYCASPSCEKVFELEQY